MKKGAQNFALEHFVDVIDELDPDNKTKLHVDAWYGQALAHWYIASSTYDDRYTERGKLTREMLASLRLNPDVVVQGGDSDEYILEHLNHAMLKFEKTHDLIRKGFHLDKRWYVEGVSISCEDGHERALELVREIREQHRD